MAAPSSVSERTLHDLRRFSFLTERARELSATADDLEQFLDTLLNWELYSDATYSLAYAMPSRLSVWWGCVCIDFVNHGEKPKFRRYSKALAQTVAWVSDPSESNRLAVRQAGQTIPYSNPHGPLTKAAGWGIDDGASAYRGPDPFATHRAIGYAIKTCGHGQRLPELLAIGLKLLDGAHRWDAKPEASADG